MGLAHRPRFDVDDRASVQERKSKPFAQNKSRPDGVMHLANNRFACVLARVRQPCVQFILSSSAKLFAKLLIFLLQLCVLLPERLQLRTDVSSLRLLS